MAKPGGRLRRFSSQTVLPVLFQKRNMLAEAMPKVDTRDAERRLQDDDCRVPKLQGSGFIKKHFRIVSTDALKRFHHPQVLTKRNYRHASPVRKNVRAKNVQTAACQAIPVAVMCRD